MKIRDILIDLDKAPVSGFDRKAKDLVADEELAERTRYITTDKDGHSMSRGATIVAMAKLVAMSRDKSVLGQLEARGYKLNMEKLEDAILTGEGETYTAMILSIGVAIGKEMSDEPA